MSKFGENLKSLRENANMKQKDLAKAIHVSESSVSGYEQGVRFPLYETLINIADLFHVSTDYLLGREKNLCLLNTNGLKDEDMWYLYVTINFLEEKNKKNDNGKNKNKDKAPLT